MHVLPPVRAVRRHLAATVVTLLVALVSAIAWVVGQAQYINDYCTTRAPQPPDVRGGRPAYMADPLTVACEFDGHPTVYVAEPAPLLGALLLTAVVVAVGVVAFRWARSSSETRLLERRPQSGSRETQAGT